jgi:molybdopterin-guanine dinucleotide biosynthesis protein A
MGRTKALIEIAGVPMATRVARALTEAGCDPVVVYGGDPVELASIEAPVLPDRYPGAGPLGGVLGVLDTFAEVGAVTHVAVLACDLPAITAATLAPLVEVARSAPDRDVVVARTDRLEPACAVWSLSSMLQLRSRFTAGERALHTAIGALGSVEVEVPAEMLLNINTPDDLGRYP